MNSLIESSMQSSAPAWLALNKVFELTLDGDAPENDPLQMVRAYGCSDPEKWKHTGMKVIGRETRRFKLVEIGYKPNFESVKKALARHGSIPEGQWREALKKRFLGAPGRLVGVADVSWFDPFGYPYFPCVNDDGASAFGWIDRGFFEYWLWLVEVK